MPPDEARPLVSVIVPVFDDAGRLAACLKALDDQHTQRTFEVIVVDNGSRDDPAAAAAHYAFARTVPEPSPGSYGARNTGARHARGDILAFTDADCLPSPAWIERGATAVERLNRPCIIAGGIDVFVPGSDGGRSTRHPVVAYELATAFRQREYVERKHFGPTANLFVTRTAFDALRGFDGRLRSGGDKDFGSRAFAAGIPLLFDAGVRVAHPSRPEVAALEAKVRRVVGGEHGLARGRRGQLISDYLRYALLRPANALRQILRTPTLDWTEKLAAALVVPRVALWQIDERRRLVRGSEARR